jgi:hypothetical protein
VFILVQADMKNQPGLRVAMHVPPPTDGWTSCDDGRTRRRSLSFDLDRWRRGDRRAAGNEPGASDCIRRRSALRLGCRGYSGLRHLLTAIAIAEKG